MLYGISVLLRDGKSSAALPRNVAVAITIQVMYTRFVVRVYRNCVCLDAALHCQTQYTVYTIRSVPPRIIITFCLSIRTYNFTYMLDIAGFILWERLTFMYNYVIKWDLFAFRTAVLSKVYYKHGYCWGGRSNACHTAFMVYCVLPEYIHNVWPTIHH